MSTYDGDFYAQQAEGSSRSAGLVVPVLMELVGPRKVLDVGCGIGTWLAEFVRAGVADVMGVDGDWVSRTALRIAEDRFRPVDLARADELPDGFDLTLCLEVAEHLPPEASDRFVAALCRTAPAVAFSAAIPHQPGTMHINTAWHEAWHARFESHGFRAVDAVRPRIREERRIEWWYRQNLFLYVRRERIPDYPKLAADAARAVDTEWVHVSLLRQFPVTPRGMIRRLLRDLWRSLAGTA